MEDGGGGAQHHPQPAPEHALPPGGLIGVDDAGGPHLFEQILDDRFAGSTPCHQGVSSAWMTPEARTSSSRSSTIGSQATPTSHRQWSRVPTASATPNQVNRNSRSRPTCWTGSSRSRQRTRSGWPTSATSGPARAGCTWPSCSTSSPARGFWLDEQMPQELTLAALDMALQR